ncbi:hypothetical protein KAW48_05620, partial [candidate division WOR-3 bacterium]|nr:hypothetical protein [candidate division WOR-3 bacterium]
IPRKMNSLGISKLALSEWKGQDGISIFIGNPKSGDYDYAVIPAPYYARSGTTTTLNGEEKEFHSVVKVGAIHGLPLQDFLNRMKE